MSHFPGRIGIVVAGAAALLAPAAGALNLDVPITHPTLQAAVAAAAVSPDADNTITISASPVATNVSIDLGAAFGPARRLLIRPATTLARATVVNAAPGVPVFNLQATANITLQDLDILRNITNNQNIVVISVGADILIERCRIGSNWPTPGAAGWANVAMTYPTNVTLRNNILFARVQGTFDFGIDAANFNDPSNALRLYNNVVADYRFFGVRVQAGVPGSLVLLRNNVVLNHPALVPEPVAFRTLVAAAGSTVVTSHNTVFASAGFEETGPAGTVDIAGLASSFLTFAPAAVGAAFVTPTWSPAPPWDANANLYHLLAAGVLHDDAGDNGMNVTNIGPDFAVLDDIDRQIRPGGIGPHTDRGADQLEAGAVSGVATNPGPGTGLRATVRGAAGGGVVIAYATTRAGRLRFQLFDAAGRLLHRQDRTVGAASEGTLDVGNWPRGAGGLVFFRLRLEAVEGAPEEVTGKVQRWR